MKQQKQQEPMTEKELRSLYKLLGRFIHEKEAGADRDPRLQTVIANVQTWVYYHANDEKGIDLREQKF